MTKSLIFFCMMFLSQVIVTMDSNSEYESKSTNCLSTISQGVALCIRNTPCYKLGKDFRVQRNESHKEIAYRMIRDEFLSASSTGILYFMCSQICCNGQNSFKACELGMHTGVALYAAGVFDIFGKIKKD